MEFAIYFRWFGEKHMYFFKLIFELVWKVSSTFEILSKNFSKAKIMFSI